MSMACSRLTQCASQVRILVIGLDNSGKTTLINHVKPKKGSTFEVRGRDASKQ